MPISQDAQELAVNTKLLIMAHLIIVSTEISLYGVQFSIVINQLDIQAVNSVFRPAMNISGVSIVEATLRAATYTGILL